MTVSSDWSSLDEDAHSKCSGDDELPENCCDECGASSSCSCDESESLCSSGPCTPENVDSADSVSSPVKSTSPPAQSGTKRSARKSALESLIKKRQRQSLSAAKRNLSVDSESQSSSSSETESEMTNSSDDSISSGSLSSNSSTSSSGGEFADPSFYVRMNATLDRKRNTERMVSESLSNRDAFLRCVQYYAICITNGGLIPRKHLIEPELLAGVRKTEKSVLGRRDSLRPSYWKPDELYVCAMERFPHAQVIRLRHRYDPSARECHSCHRAGYTHVVKFTGKPYDSQLLWKGDMKSWMRSEGLDVDESSTDHDHDDYDDFNESGYLEEYIENPIEVGTTCAAHARAFHGLQHLKRRMLDGVVRFLESRVLMSKSPVEITRSLHREKDGIVEEWYEKFQAVLSASEHDLSASKILDDDNVVEDVW